MNLHNGDCVRVKHLKVRFGSDGQRAFTDADFSAPKGKCFVLVLLGTEPSGGPVMDEAEAIRKLGWVQAEYELAPLCDFVNTEAREVGVREAGWPNRKEIEECIRRIIDRLRAEGGKVKVRI